MAKLKTKMDRMHTALCHLEDNELTKLVEMCKGDENVQMWVDWLEAQTEPAIIIEYTGKLMREVFMCIEGGKDV